MDTDPHAQIRETPAEIREMQPSATREARSADDIWAEVWEHPWAGFAITATLPGFVLSLLGPFGSFGAPLWARFAYWMPTMALGALLGASITMWAERSPLFHGKPILRVLAITTLMTAAMSGVAWGMARLVFGAGSVRFTAEFIFYVWLITMIVSIVSAIIRARRVAVAAAPVPAAQAPPSTLVSRLPDRLKNGAILALQSEDHYVRVHTDRGSDLILMRLSDAIEAMGTTPGARTHRSWWVSKGAIKTLRRDNGKVSLLLSNEVEAPVSRGYAAELRDAGWFDE